MAAVKRLQDRDGEVAEDSVAYQVTGDFDLGSLSVGLSEALGGGPAEIVVEGDVVWVLDKRIDAGMLDTTLQAHTQRQPLTQVEAEPEPKKDMNDKRAVSVDVGLLRDLAAKPENEQYDQDEIQSALRALLASYKES